MQYLLRRQGAAGDWAGDATTGTGFPGVFYLRYDFYRINWPLLALAGVREWFEKNETPAIFLKPQEVGERYNSDA